MTGPMRRNRHHARKRENPLLCQLFSAVLIVASGYQVLRTRNTSRNIFGGTALNSFAQAVLEMEQEAYDWPIHDQVVDVAVGAASCLVLHPESTKG